MEGDVRVRAVVMTRDDSSGGWVPLGGGGLSHVVICKGRSPEKKGRRDYFIRGERLRDRAPVLECSVQRGLVYNKVNPIFHHWRVEDRKFGLTFQSPADAISFEQSLHSAIDRLDRESDSAASSTSEDRDTEDEGRASHTDSESSSNSRKEMLPKAITIVTSESSSPSFVRSAAEDYGYEAGHAVPTQTPSQIHPRPTHHHPLQVTATVHHPVAPPPLTSPTNPPAPVLAPPALSPLILWEEGDLCTLDPCKDVWGSRGYEDYRRAGAARTALGGGVIVGGGVSSSQDKFELCMVRFQKELAGVGSTGCEVTVTLDTKGLQCHPAVTLSSGGGPDTGSGAAKARGSPQDTGKGSPSPCCIHTSLAAPRTRTRKRGGGGGVGGGGGSDYGLTAAHLGGPISPEEGSPRPQGSSSCSSRCVYCRAVFSTSENGRGRCRDAPDPASRCLRQWTCVWCAESLLYHCASDAEGEFWEPCSCEDPSGGRPHALCCARWAALLALSLLVPCMCCYLPLHSCLRCGERCGFCGGKHKAVR